MIFGTAKVSPGYLETSNDSYPITANTVISVPRPFLAMGISLSVMLGVFGAAFSDLLYVGELAVLATSAAFLAVMGLMLAQLVIITPVTRGSEMTVAVWGTYGSLNKKRKELAVAARGSARS